ncbi:MAG: hypothetical protein IJQ68_04120 [Methanobrevibacter sp.]|uniref:hypothetical protein n=1 Tax=Methanobrevibacter sp. TaxID=66852 RepID=UPI0025F1983E|nr:hypothetical protein [Methanobrevibacter sp.]MBR0271163.1 hypothetical protein [Methanobrevibacter sp.]
MEDFSVKKELIYSMQCMIHKYAKSIDDINRLEGMIGLNQISGERNLVYDNMRIELTREITRELTKEITERVTNEVMKEGIEEGKLIILNGLANDSDNNYTAEELSEKFGISVEKILNGK